MGLLLAVLFVLRVPAMMLVVIGVGVMKVLN